MKVVSIITSEVMKLNKFLTFIDEVKLVFKLKPEVIRLEAMLELHPIYNKLRLS